MTSRTTERFRSAYAELPEHIRRRARAAYRLFLDNPQHPSLRFKQIHATRPIYRALAVLDGDLAVWFWIGTHADYDRLLRSL